MNLIMSLHWNVDLLSLTDFVSLVRIYVTKINVERSSKFQSFSVSLSLSLSGMMTRGQWVNLAINVSSIVTGVFSSTFKSIELICISANCKLRKVFTMRHQPHNTNTGLYWCWPVTSYQSYHVIIVMNIELTNLLFPVCQPYFIQYVTQYVTQYASHCTRHSRYLQSKLRGSNRHYT